MMRDRGHLPERRPRVVTPTAPIALGGHRSRSLAQRLIELFERPRGEGRAVGGAPA